MKISDSRRGGIFTGLLMIVAAIVLLAVVSGLFVARNVKIASGHNGGNDVSIDIPGGHFSIQGHNDIEPGALGIPIYPGAKRVKKGGGATFEWFSDDGKSEKGLTVAGVELFTPDPAGKVLDYYRAQLPNWIVITDRDGSTRLEFKEGGAKRIVAIHERSDGTHIGVASVGEPASN